MHDPPISSPPPAETEPTAPTRATRSLLRRLHFYAGILVAPFVVVAAISGALYALSPTLENVVYERYLHTDSTGTVRPLAEQVSSAVATRPDLTLSAVRPSSATGDTTRVLFDDPSLGESERRAVFVDPVTARPVGELVSYGSAAALPLRTWIDQFHRNLHLGEPGRIYSELAASWLWVVALGGLALWIGRYRRGNGRARLFGIDRAARGHQKTLGWHGAMGIWLVIGLVFLSATGLTWSRYAGDNVTELRSALHWTTPAVATDLAGTETAEHATHDGHSGHTSAAAMTDTDAGARIAALDAVQRAADAAGVHDKVEITIPASTDTAYTVTETRQPWQLSPNSVSVDGRSHSVVDESWFADWPLAAKLATWGIALHMGILFGLPSQIALFVLAIGLVAVIVRGYQMWWQRRPRNRSRPVGRAPERGALRDIPVGVLAALVVLTVAIGWFVPLLGISLAAFLLVDLALGLRKRLSQR
ncbi:PepSY domain-containing protein [Gordonia sp. CPCC 206044]|uniref:PepSY-associated TM helix domain-containing protein n=1 Tax=Gordonia sp. CPCC 206044 TaxID=3140793 RepID=UPI003AF3C49F